MDELQGFEISRNLAIVNYATSIVLMIPDQNIVGDLSYSSHDTCIHKWGYGHASMVRHHESG